jgi:flagellar protein FlaF
VLSKAAVMLKQCQDCWESADLTQMLSEALKYNQKVWSFFQTEIANPDNPLPKKLKEDLLSLSIFVDKRIFEIISYPSPEKLTAIININLNIAAGLRASQ